VEIRSILQSWWWMPSYDVLQLVERGGVATVWGAWFNAIAFWSLYFIIFNLFVSSTMLLFRRRWIDVEMIPFPYVIATYDVIAHSPMEFITLLITWGLVKDVVR